MLLGVLRVLSSLDLRRDLESKRIQADEPGRVILVVGLCGIGLHGRNRRVIKAHRGFSPRYHDVSLIELHPHGAGYILLAP